MSQENKWVRGSRLKYKTLQSLSCYVRVGRTTATPAAPNAPCKILLTPELIPCPIFFGRDCFSKWLISSNACFLSASSSASVFVMVIALLLCDRMTQVKRSTENRENSAIWVQWRAPWSQVTIFPGPVRRVAGRQLRNVTESLWELVESRMARRQHTKIALRPGKMCVGISTTETICRMTSLFWMRNFLFSNDKPRFSGRQTKDEYR
jgi:hypothetical protein